MPDEATVNRLREVRARRWSGEQLSQALARCGWSAGALARIRGIGSSGGGRVDTRWVKTVKRWLNNKLDVDPVQQEWLERVLIVIATGPSLFDGPPGPMTAAQFRDLAWRLEWDVLAWTEAAARGNAFASFGDVFGVPQSYVQTLARGEEPIPERIGNALATIMDGVRGREDRPMEDGHEQSSADQQAES